MIDNVNTSLLVNELVVAYVELDMYPIGSFDNSLKRKNSFLFIYHDVIIVCVVVEKTKTTQYCQVVSAFPVHYKIYKKMVDISGGAESPPFELPV